MVVVAVRVVRVVSVEAVEVLVLLETDVLDVTLDVVVVAGVVVVVGVVVVIVVVVVVVSVTAVAIVVVVEVDVHTPHITGQLSRTMIGLRSCRLDAAVSQCWGIKPPLPQSGDSFAPKHALGRYVVVVVAVVVVVVVVLVVVVVVFVVVVVIVVVVVVGEHVHGTCRSISIQISSARDCDSVASSTHSESLSSVCTSD